MERWNWIKKLSKRGTREEEGRAMAKKTVKFTCIDAPQPTDRGGKGMIVLGAPLDLSYEAGHEYTLDLGFTCDRPLALFSSSVLEVIGNWLVPPNVPARVQVRARIGATITRGERILFAVPLGLCDFEIG